MSKARGRRLRTWRGAHELTQEQMAVHLDVHWSTLAKWERGETIPKTKSAFKIEELTGGEILAADWVTEKETTHE